MTEAATRTLPADSAPSALAAPQDASASCAPVWLLFCIMACSAFASLLGRFAPLSFSQSPNPYDDSPDVFGDHSFAILFRLIAIDWFRRSRTMPATPAELLRRSPVAQAILSQPLAPIQPCDLPGQSPTPGTFAPAFANHLAAAPGAPLALTPTSFLNAYFAALSTPTRPALSTRNRALLDDEANPDAFATPLIAYSTLIQSAIFYSAFPRAPV